MLGLSVITIMVAFSKFITDQRNSRQLLDMDGYTYVRRKDKDTSTAAAWRCTKNSSLKCVCHVYLNPTDDTVIQGTKSHKATTTSLTDRWKRRENSSLP